MIAEAWLRGGKTGSGRGAARQLKQAITTARAIDPHATLMARGDSAFGTKKVIGACLHEQVEFSLTLSRNRRVTTAIEAIDDDAFTPVHYPGAVEDPDTGALISDAEVAETPYTLTVRGHARVTARLVVRRVKDARYPDALFPVWRYHPFFTNSELPTTEADITHRKHAIVETTFADQPADVDLPACQAVVEGAVPAAVLGVSDSSGSETTVLGAQHRVGELEQRVGTAVQTGVVVATEPGQSPSLRGDHVGPLRMTSTRQ